MNEGIKMFDMQMDQSEIMISPMSCYCGYCLVELRKITETLSVCPMCRTTYVLEKKEYDSVVKGRPVEIDEDLGRLRSATDV